MLSLNIKRCVNDCKILKLYDKMDAHKNVQNRKNHVIQEVLPYKKEKIQHKC